MKNKIRKSLTAIFFATIGSVSVYSVERSCSSKSDMDALKPHSVKCVSEQGEQLLQRFETLLPNVLNTYNKKETDFNHLYPILVPEFASNKLKYVLETYIDILKIRKEEKNGDVNLLSGDAGFIYLKKIFTDFAQNYSDLNEFCYSGESLMKKIKDFVSEFGNEKRDLSFKCEIIKKYLSLHPGKISDFINKGVENLRIKNFTKENLKNLGTSNITNEDLKNIGLSNVTNEELKNIGLSHVTNEEWENIGRILRIFNNDTSPNIYQSLTDKKEREFYQEPVKCIELEFSNLFKNLDKVFDKNKDQIYNKQEKTYIFYTMNIPNEFSKEVRTLLTTVETEIHKIFLKALNDPNSLRNFEGYLKAIRSYLKVIYRPAGFEGMKKLTHEIQNSKLKNNR